MRFYVYELVDPRDQRVFYVGKGCRYRLSQHARQAERGQSGPRFDYIRRIFADGLKPIERVVRRFNLEADAYDFERDHIAFLGLENLTNVVPGGNGSRSAPKRFVVSDAAWMKLWPKVRRVLLMRWVGGSFHLGHLDITKAVDAVISAFLRGISDQAFRELIEREQNARSHA